MHSPYFPYKCALLATITLGLLILLMLQPPITTPDRYLTLADQRTWLDIPNAWNVLSNLPFMIVGLLGLWVLFKPKEYQIILFRTPRERLFYVIFFLGVFFVGFGSGGYHWSPNNYTLMWDRLPIAIAMMSFVSAMMAERINLSFARFMLWPLLVIGIVGVVYWYLTLTAGREDLKLYMLTLVFFPIVTIPVILILFKSPYTHTQYLWYALLSFLIARIAEGYDALIYHFLHGVMSGHTLKHLLMSVSCLCVYLYLRRRKEKQQNYPIAGAA